MQVMKINDIKTNPNNPRFIKDDKFANLVKSVKDFPKYKRTTDLFEINREYQEDVGKNHTCPKQIKLIADILQNYSSKIVLDLFGGSGTTMVACHQLNRKCYMSELDPKYVQTIIHRMIKLDSTLEIKRNGVPYENTL